MDTLLEQATPRPWRIDGKDHRWLAENDEGQYVYVDDPANAQLIVRAVNAYEPLVKALRQLIAATDPIATSDEPPPDEVWQELGAAAVHARAALTTVESSPERDGGEHRPAIGLSSAGAHKLCMKCGEPWPCRSVSDR